LAMVPELLHEIRLAGVIPRHVAVIMDGNGRWARQRSLPRTLGHRAGMKAVREAVEGAVEAGVEILTLFAFSTENWHRPWSEISALMALLQRYADREREELRARGVQVRVLGELERMDDATRRAVDQIVESTSGGTQLRLNLMISYSGREEILRATRILAERVARGELDPDAINEESFRSGLFTCDLPDPDLLIRTSGEFRISNFMLWQLAYTEIHITPVLWPDFTRDHLFAAVRDYQQRDRRFGRVPAG
jgi:undecaprenyl diphosphate synthase